MPGRQRITFASGIRKLTRDIDLNEVKLRPDYVGDFGNSFKKDDEVEYVTTCPTGHIIKKVSYLILPLGTILD